MSLMVSCFIESNEILNVQTRTISCFGNRIVRWEGSDLVRKNVIIIINKNIDISSKVAHIFQWMQSEYSGFLKRKSEREKNF